MKMTVNISLDAFSRYKFLSYCRHALHIKPSYEEKPKPSLEVLQNLSKHLNGFQNTSWHCSLNTITTFLLQLDTSRHILKYEKKNPWMGCPFHNCTLLALLLCHSMPAFLSVGSFSLASVRAVPTSAWAPLPSQTSSCSHCGSGPSASMAGCCRSSHHSFTGSSRLTPCCCSSRGRRTCPQGLLLCQHVLGMHSLTLTGLMELSVLKKKLFTALP